VPEAPADRSSYLLQAGAFKGQEDAESMKVKLALIGFEARIVTAEVNGTTFYRVRVGPYGQIEDMNRARSRLAENGIEASVVRSR
jgi:cell division protein FtsN